MLNLMRFAFECRCCCFDLRGKPLKALKELRGGNICQHYPAANYVPHSCRFARACRFKPRVCESDDDIAVDESNAGNFAGKDFFFVQRVLEHFLLRAVSHRCLLFTLTQAQ